MPNEIKKGSSKSRKQYEIYKAKFSRYMNAVKKLKRHIKHHPEDHKAKKWLEFMNGMLAVDYKRGNNNVKKKWETLFNAKS